jgi:hypothetical protein
VLVAIQPGRQTHRLVETVPARLASILQRVLVSGAVVVASPSAAAFAQEITVDGRTRHSTLHVRLHLKAAAQDLSLPRVAEEIRAICAPDLKLVVMIGEEACSACSDAIDVFIDDIPPPPPGTALGWIDFENGEPTRNITVSLPQVRLFLRHVMWMDRRISDAPKLWKEFLARGVGRAAAHEIGHYVLRSAAHHATGLMRSGLNPNDLMRPNRDRLRLVQR